MRILKYIGIGVGAVGFGVIAWMLGSKKVPGTGAAFLGPAWEAGSAWLVVRNSRANESAIVTTSAMHIEGFVDGQAASSLPRDYDGKVWRIPAGKSLVLRVGSAASDAPLRGKPSPFCDFYLGMSNEREIPARGPNLWGQSSTIGISNGLWLLEVTEVRDDVLQPTLTNYSERTTTFYEILREEQVFDRLPLILRNRVDTVRRGDPDPFIRR